MLRIGGNDLMNILGLRRPRQLTLYDTPLASVISQLVTVFKPYNFALSAPVFEYLNDNDTLQKEIRLDLAYGLCGKTAIHPSQIADIEAAYSVELDDYEMAVKLVDNTSPAVFKMHHAMCEVATHRQWAVGILNRQQCYGFSDEKSLDCVEVSV
jgi:citrate lyase beta subunit